MKKDFWKVFCQVDMGSNESELMHIWVNGWLVDAAQDEKVCQGQNIYVSFFSFVFNNFLDEKKITESDSPLVGREHGGGTLNYIS